MTCPKCGTGNFYWARACTQCGAPLAAAPAGAAAVPSDGAEPGPVPPERELQLTLPEPEDPRIAEERAVREAFAHTPRPFVAPLFLAANVLVFLVMAARGASPMSPDTTVLQQWGANYGPSISAGEWWRLFTATFLHAGLPHLLFNMVALFSIGFLTERMFGHVSFLVLYLLAGLAGSVVSVYWHPLATGVGASGAIFGLYGGLFGFLAVARKSLPPEVLSSLRNGAALFVLYNVLFGMMQQDVDMAAHLAGLGAGVVAGMALARPGASVSHGVRAQRGVLVGLAGAAVLALAASRLPVQGDWAGAVRTLAALEQRAETGIGEAMQKVTDGRLGEDAFADYLEQEFVVPWRQHRERVAALPLPPRERALALKAVAYMDHRTAGWHLEAEAFRREDRALMEQSNREHAAANEAGREFLRSLGGASGETAAAAPRTGADAGQAALSAATEELTRLEKASLELYNGSVRSAREGRAGQMALADLVETRILKPWDAQTQRIATLRTSGPVEGSRKQIEQYMRLRGEAWRQTARALRDDSAALMTQANATHAKAAAMFGDSPARSK